MFYSKSTMDKLRPLSKAYSGETEGHFPLRLRRLTGLAGNLKGNTHTWFNNAKIYRSIHPLTFLDSMAFSEELKLRHFKSKDIDFGMVTDVPETSEGLYL